MNDELDTIVDENTEIMEKVKKKSGVKGNGNIPKGPVMGKNDIKGIPQLSGANVKVDSVADLTIKSTEFVINVDTTEEEVLDLMERYEKVDVIFPPKVFLKLSEGTVEKLPFASKEKYFLAKMEHDNIAKNDALRAKDETFGKISLNGGDVGSRMALSEGERADLGNEHFALLNDYEMDNAKANGYRKIKGSEPVRNFNPVSKTEEVLHKVKLPMDTFLAHQKAISSESKGKVRNRKSEGKYSTFEISRDTEGTEIKE